jgi:hypothetical protein
MRFVLEINLDVPELYDEGTRTSTAVPRGSLIGGAA